MTAAPSGLRVTTPGDRDIVLVREFAAPAGLVFDALTTPELLVRWYGARGWSMIACDVDLRVGRAWRFISSGPDHELMGQRGVYREIVRPERLVYTEVFDDQSYLGEALITQTLAEHGGRTTLTSTVRYPSPAAREIVLRYPMARGVVQAYERLDAVLTELAQPRKETHP